MKLTIAAKIASKLEWVSSKSNMKGKITLTFNRRPTKEEFEQWCIEHSAQAYLSNYSIKDENVEVKVKK